MASVIYLSPRFASGEISVYDLDNTQESPEEQLRTAITNAGMTPPDIIELDGKIHRFKSSEKSGKTGWYIAFNDGIAAGKFGDWREGTEQAWRAGMGRKLTPAEEIAFSSRMREAKRHRDEMREVLRVETSNNVAKIWENAPNASADHPYLISKGVQAHCSRISPDGRLIVPMFDVDGDILSLQYIDHAGVKRFHPGGKTSGAFWALGNPNGSDIIYIAEGFATAATIHEVSGKPCVVAFSANNLVHASEAAIKLWPTSKAVVVADNDESGVGQRAAEDVKRALGIDYIMPPVLGDANDYHLAGHNLLDLLEPKHSEIWLIPADEFSAQPAPIRWLVKGWLPRDSLIMLHGPSGSGKSFVMIDLCMRIASGLTEWSDYRVRPGAVIYLAGEGHHGMRARLAAWRERHQVGHSAMWVSSSGCDLNTHDGYLKALSAIKSLNTPVDLIVIDTLHRFLSGDENSAQDTKTMLDAASALMRECSASVVFVHHTGVSEEAQHRGRGSSAWRGALDIEISVIPKNDETPIQIVQRKTKDTEIAPPIYAELVKTAITGWIDEDNEQVYSAILQIIEHDPIKAELSAKLAQFAIMFESAWFASGAHELGGKPYITRDQLRHYLIIDCQKKESTVNQIIKPGADGKLICELIKSGLIIVHGDGFIALDNDFSENLLRKKNPS